LNSYLDPSSNAIVGLILLQNLLTPANQLRTTINNIGIEQNDASGNITIDVSWDNLKSLKEATPALRIPDVSSNFVVNDTYEANDNNLAKTRIATLSAVSATDPTLALEVLTSGEKATLTQDTLTYLDASGGTAVSASWASIIAGSATPSLSSVLAVGNTATNSIALNNAGTNVITLDPSANEITITDGTTTNTINKTGYTTRNSVQNSTHFLNFSDSSATGTGAIQKTAGISCNPSTNIITATTFVGDLSGNATTATTSTNIAGGAGGSIPYQTAVNTTALLANGSSGQFLKSLGGTNPPFWDSLPVASTPTLSQVLVAGNSAGATSIDMSGNNITNATSITSTIFVGDLSGNATTATNISGGAGGQVLYQSASGTTAKLANGTSGQVLTSAGTTLAPTWTTPSGGGNASNTASKIYNEDFNYYNLSTANPYGELSMLFTNATWIFNGVASRVGVIQLTSPSFVGLGYGASFISAPSGTITPANSEGIMPSAISNSLTGLGMTFIFLPYQASYANADILFGLARWDTYAVFTAGYNNITIYYNATTQKWGGRIGNAFTPFPSVPTGTLNAKWLVGRIVPSATGATFYLYNTTDSVDYGSVSILYSADTAGTTASTLYMRIGGGIKSFSASTQTIFCDYCGFETNFQRIYP
jgi:hypothetical protein